MTVKPKKIVVKDNSLIDASFNLSLVEQRLMLLAIVEAREFSELTYNTPVEVSAKSYMEQFGINEKESYSALRDAALTLKRREFSYIDRYKSFDAVTCDNWVNKITYVKDQGLVVLYFTDIVIKMISRLEQQFTRYYLDQVSNFKSKYSIRLYELIMKWRIRGMTQRYDIDDLRSKLGIEPQQYKTMSLFKANVLERALEEINDQTDLIVSYEQFKQGKTITHLQFKLEPKDPKTVQIIEGDDLGDFNYNLTEPQIDLFSSKLSQDPLFGSQHANMGETSKEFQTRIKSMLSDPDWVEQNLETLMGVGFIP